MACTVGIGNTPTMTTVPPPILYHRWVGWHAPAMRRAAGVALIGLVVALVLLRFVTWGLAVVAGWDVAALAFLMTVWLIIVRATALTPSSWPRARTRPAARQARRWSGPAPPACWGSASRSSLPGETAAHDECCSSASQGCAPEQTIRGQRHRLAVVQVMRPARRPAFWPAAFWPARRPRRWDPTWLGDRLLVSCGREAGRRAGGHRAGPGARPATARSRCPAHARRPRACPTRGCARRPGRRRGPCR